MTDLIKTITENNTYNSAIKKTHNEKNRAMIDGKRADTNIYYCEPCDYCWEYISKRTKKRNKIYTYKYFPTYKKKRLLCPKIHELVI